MVRQKSSLEGTYRPVKLDKAGLAAVAFDRFKHEYPALFKESSAYQLSRAAADMEDHVGALQESLATGRPALFLDYVHHASTFFAFRHLPPPYIPDGLRILREVIRDQLDGDLRERAEKILGTGIVAARKISPEPPSGIDDSDPLSGTAHAYLEALIRTDRNKAGEILTAAADSGVPLRDLYLRIFVPVLQETGRLWEIQKLSVAEEHYITASIGAEMTRLHDRYIPGGVRGSPEGKTVLVAAVEGDLHEIGIRMIADFFEMDGWSTYYIGPNTPALSLLRAARERNVDLIVISCSMPPFLPTLHYLIRSLHADAGTKKIKILVGGHPFAVDPPLWKQIGADAYAKDAVDAVGTAHRLMG
ncbi:cobalamin B12-binding domain-containing protein [Methanoregula sp.]|uniref:cobalamin B12-binding domain-containing protein n=1 Tax=Methanoregula sp. TaxID=2052170 RepID=UPI002BB03459|nr:cobalamin-dependent protein [Methanoregula sp.]HVP96425.1 cobalamin-dependent protein [Methanoregula sp.]